jgi:hypothetical protein
MKNRSQLILSSLREGEVIRADRIEQTEFYNYVGWSRKRVLLPARIRL